MRIRVATERDSASLAQVQVNSYRTAYAGLMPAEYLAAFSYEEQTRDWQDLIRADRDLLLVAVSADGQVLGYALARRVPDGSMNFDCELVALHVSADCQRQGIGRSLITEAARRMRTKGCRSLGLWVLDGNPARQFYERLGGQENGEQFFEIEEFNLRRREVGYWWERIEELLESA